MNAGHLRIPGVGSTIFHMRHKILRPGPKLPAYLVCSMLTYRLTAPEAGDS
jgi:hypothetical protein